MAATDLGLTYVLTIGNFILQNDNYKEVYSPSRIHCVTQCSLDETCLSVFYKAEKGMCIPVNETYSDSSTLKSGSGYEYFVKEDKCLSFKILTKADKGSSVYDWQVQKWHPTNKSIPLYAQEIAYNGDDDLYFTGQGRIGFTSLTTGATVEMARWMNIEAIYGLDVDVKEGLLFHTLLIDQFWMIKMDIQNAAINKTIHILGKTYRYTRYGCLALDRQNKKIYAIVSPMDGGKEKSLLSMTYDGNEDTIHSLTSDTIYRLTFDEKEKQPVYASDSGIFIYDVTTGSSKRFAYITGITSPRNIALAGDVIAVIDETKQSSSIKMYSRRGTLKHELKYPHGPLSGTQFYQTCLVLVKY